MSTDEQAAVDAPGRSWVEVRGGALRRNFRRIRDSVGAASAIIPMVKADAYGLGMEAVVQALEPEGPWGYGVATVEEGARLRAGGVVKPVVIVSPLPPEAYDLAVAEALTPTLSEVDALDRLAASAERLGREAPLPRGDRHGDGALRVRLAADRGVGSGVGGAPERSAGVGGLLHALPLGRRGG